MKSQPQSARSSHRMTLSSITRIAAFVALVALIGIPLFSRSLAFSSGPVAKTPEINAAQLEQSYKEYSSKQMFRSGSGMLNRLPMLMPQAQPPESIATYETLAGNCTNTASSSFLTGQTVCVKANSSFPEPLSIYWVDPDGAVVQIDPITSTNPSGTRMVNAKGNWRAYLVSRADGSARYVVDFSVSDPSSPAVDLAVVKGSTTGTATAGGAISYHITVKNYGPDTAATVVLTDTVPANLAYSDSSQDSGPAFTRTATTPTTTWELASLPAGASADFTFNYTVTGSAGATINNTASVRSATDEQFPNDNDWTATDSISGSGGGSTCSLDCPNNIVTTATTHGSGGGANVTYTAPEAFGTCGTVTSTPASGSFFPIGTTTVTSSSSTGGGFCSFTVTVIDSAAPTITCPSNITVTANAGESQAYVPDPSQSSSNVGTPTSTGTNVLVTGSRDDGEALTGSYPIGTTVITWVATEYDRDPQDVDAQPTGRSASCQQTIRVNGSSTLSISCPPNQTVNSPTGCDPAPVDPGTATSNSGSATILGRRSDNLAYSNQAEFNNPFPVGVTTIDWTATGSDGQSASCTQTITVNGTDTTPPTLNVPPDVSATTSTCTATLDDELGVATADDDCGTVSITRSGVPTFACPTPSDPNRRCESFVFPTGTTIITYTATNSSGLSTTGTQRVVVTEDPAIPPTITAPADSSANADANCQAAVPNYVAGSTASDNCGNVTVTQSPAAGTLVGYGPHTVIVTATDPSGNTASDNVVFTVNDATAPSITAPADSSANADSSCQAAVPDYRPSTVASDNCGSVTLTQSPAPGTLVGYGPHTVTVTANDGHGNTASDDVVFTVNDVTPPSITAPADSSAFADGSCLAPVPNYMTGTVAADNCGSVTLSQSPAPGTLVGYGPHTVTVTANDGHGNTNSDTVVFTVNDNTPPVFTSCPTSITIESTCPSGAIGTYATPTATDNCGVTVTRTAGPASGSVFPIGTTTVTHVANDGHGNTATCTFTVTVLTPQAVVQNLINSVNASSLNGTQKNGLLAKLNAALTAMNGGGGNACAKLSDFVNSVGTLISHGDITAAQGNAWISSANHVRNAIGCTNLGCS
jgi:uncharacterized repeat protein (TIGR01451 family)